MIDFLHLWLVCASVARSMVCTPLQEVSESMAILQSLGKLRRWEEEAAKQDVLRCDASSPRLAKQKAVALPR